MPSGTAAKVLAALEKHDLKEEKPGKYRCNSPFRPGSDSRSFTLTINGPEFGAFHDHHASANPASGSLYDLAKQLGIAIPASIPVPSTKRGYAGLEDYAKAHGITGDALRAWHWRETTYQGRPALEFMTRSGRRWRFLDGAKNKPVYTSESGYRRCWYGLSKSTIEACELMPLVLCNGEISTIAAQYHKVPAIAMTSGEKAEIPDDLLNELKGQISTDTHILIALDCDRAGRAAARGLEHQLKGAGYNARAVDLGLSAGGDLADFCMMYQEESLVRLIDLPGLPVDIEDSPWQFATIDDILKMGPIDWLIPKLLPARGLCMLYGPSGSYKSFYALDNAMNLAAQGHSIVYIAAEGEYGYRQRLEAWIKHHKTQPDNIVFVLGQVDLFNSADLTEFSRIVEVYKPRLIIVDTLAMCSGEADENNSRDMAIIVHGCKTMIRALSCSIVIVHHTNQEGKRERGAKNLRNSCDTIIRVTLDDDQIMVQSQKTKDTEAFVPYYLAPVVVSLGYKNNIGEDVTSVVLLPSEKVIRTEKLTANQMSVLAALATQPNATMAELSDVTEIENRGSVQRAVARLVKLGLVLITPAGLREITPAGLQALDSTDSADSADSHGLGDVADQRLAESCESCESVESGATPQPLLTSPVRDAYYGAGL